MFKSKYSERAQERRDKLDIDFAAAYGMSWLKLPGLADSSFNFEMNQLRSSIIFNIKDEVAEFLDLYKERINDALNWKDSEGNTLLMIAAREGHIDILQILLAKSSHDQMSQKNKADNNIKEIARKYRRSDIIKLLDER